jgi:flagellar assembly protein FliH
MRARVLKRAGQTAGGPVPWRLAPEQAQSALARGHASFDVGAGEGDAAGGPAQVEGQIQESYQRGFREGETAARATLQPVLERLAHSIEALAGLRVRARREAEGDLLKLSIAIARRILHRELSVDPEAISGLIKAALEKVQQQEVHRVRVHPDLEPAVRRALENLAAGRIVQVTPDRGRLPGDVVFETQRGSLDASVETQLQEIGRGLADRLRGGT